MTRRLRNTVEDERGSVLATVAVMLPVIFLFVSLVIDVGNWLEHKKHLQLQADAAALAAARNLGTGGDCTSAVQGVVNAYGGGTYNAQVGGTQSNVTLLVNQPNYYNQSFPNDTDIPSTNPCAAMLVDVKASEENPPFWIFGVARDLFGISAPRWVNAQARVSLLEQNIIQGSLPIAVPDTNPVDAAVIFFDETKSQTDASAILAVKGMHKCNDTVLNGKTLTPWKTVSDALTCASPSAVGVPVVDQTGVVIALSGTSSWSLSGSLDTICNQVFVECYQGLDTGPYKGLGFVQGYASSGGSGPVIVRRSRLCGQAQTLCGPKVGTPVGLCNEQSAPYFLRVGGCKLNFEVQLDTPGVKAGTFEVALDAPGCSGGSPNGCTLKPNNPCSWGGTGCYVIEQYGGKFPNIDAQGGPYRLSINWKGKDVDNKNISGTLSNVQGVYAANDDPAYSGPIQFMRVMESTATNDSHSVPTGTQSFTVMIGTIPSLKSAADTSDPIVKLRVARDRTTSSGSQTQSVDCDPNPPIAAEDPGYTTLWQELAYGCWPQYTKNAGTGCPSSVPALWSSPQPWDCVAIQTGVASNQVPEGLNVRILGSKNPSTCPGAGQLGHNNWTMYDPNAPNDGFPTGDPRIVSVVLSQFGSFTGSGGGTRPITGFATFYVTGWTGSGSGFSNPCQPPPASAGDDPAPSKAYIVGHFIRYVNTLNSGGGFGPCNPDPTALNPCVAVLTR